jgi:Domain of unknown function (DUF5117)
MRAEVFRGGTMRLISVALLVLGLAPAATAQERPAQAAERPPDRTPSVSDRTKDLKRYDGFVSFYWDGKKGQLLIEVSRWNEDFLYGSGLAGGAGTLEISLDRGQESGLKLCRFERVGPRVLLRQKQMTHVSGVSDPERSRVVEESFPSAVLAALPIAAEEGDRVLADATAFLLADTDVVPALKQAKLGDWKQDTARSALYLARSGAFPRNTEIEATLTYSSENRARWRACCPTATR